ncbi:MAG: hypothetical protein HOP15_14200 [Planctomycetes bacterium]|nr:hypothetical protein [Planctomycetota bacterium]
MLLVLVFPVVALVSVDAVAGEGTVDRLGSSLWWLVVLSFVVGLYCVLRLFNHSKDHNLFGEERPEVHVRRLRELGMLVESECRVRRAFAVESDNEGSQYVCELDDGSCLLLRGQFLWDYEHSWTRRGRRFPNTRFVLQEAARPRYVVGLVCLGEPFEPELVAPGFTGDESIDQELFVGEVTRSARPYEELRHQLLHERPLRSSEP